MSDTATPGRLFAPRLDRIPQELRALDQWVVWRAEWLPDKGKYNKIPHNARTGREAKSNDPTTWSSFEEAAAFYSDNKDRFAGVGFVLHEDDPFAGVDLDDAIEGGQLTPEAERFVALLNSYTEVSPSGKGLRIFTRATLPPGGRKKGKIEMYEAGRFLTVTGRVWPNLPLTVEERQAQIEAMHAEVWPPTPPRAGRKQAATSADGLPTDDNDLLQLAYRASNGPKIEALYRGDTSAYNGDRSAADLALCSLLAFYTGDDPARLDRLFRGSGLMRDKWGEKHFSNGDTYGQRTVKMALDGCTEFYSPPGVESEAVTERMKRRSEAATSADGLPTIETNHRHIREIAADAYAALIGANDPPCIFTRDGRLVRIGEGEKGPRIQELTAGRLSYHLARAANLVSTSEKRGTVPVAPGQKLVEDVLAFPAFPGIPPLDGIVTSPVVAPNGQLVTTPGYLSSARLFYHEAEPLSLPDTKPTPGAISKAKDLLLNTLLVDFPFVEDGEEGKRSASRANALALLFLPFVRPRINGPTPLHLIDAPTPGSGKGLLAEATSAVFIPGGAAASPSPGANEDEWRKRITSGLLGGASHIWFDNIAGRLASPSLAAALTAPVWKDRLLGTLTEVNLPILNVWVGTANNVELDKDTTRRTVWIRIDTGEEHPEDRAGFKIADLRRYVRENRASLLWAVLTLLRAWIDAGSPTWSKKPLGSFESWSLVMGGILECIGVEGFLENREELNNRADPEREKWCAFFAAWHEKHADAAVGTADIADLALEYEILDEDTRGARNAFGRALAKKCDAIFGGFKLEAAKKRNRLAQYRMKNVSNVSPVSATAQARDVSGAPKDTPCEAAGGDTFDTVDTYVDEDPLLSDPFRDEKEGDPLAWTRS